MPEEKTVNERRAAGVLLVQVDPKCRPMSFLLMKHADRWDLPKGHCDGDETFRATAEREFAEETGVDAKTLNWDTEFQFDLQYEVHRGQRTWQKHVRYYLATCRELPQIVPTEHEGYQWWDYCPPHEIQSQTIDPLLAATETHFKALLRG
ncbi:MAG: NUDIX domain-containing protein [Planctomycetota bacterium]